MQTFPKFRDTNRPMVVITTPYMRIEAKQRRPLKPGQLADPLYGEWLDVFISLYKPLPEPVGGLIGVWAARVLLRRLHPRHVRRPGSSQL